MSEQTPDETAELPTPTMTDAELFALGERIAGWKRMTWGPYNVAIVLDACDRLLATARLAVEAQQDREYFCHQCNEFRSVTLSGDVVCATCAFIIATYRDAARRQRPSTGGGDDA